MLMQYTLKRQGPDEKKLIVIFFFIFRHFAINNCDEIKIPYFI